jgi:hypothetical protein
MSVKQTFGAVSEYRYSSYSFVSTEINKASVNYCDVTSANAPWMDKALHVVKLCYVGECNQPQLPTTFHPLILAGRVLERESEE